MVHASDREGGGYILYRPREVNGDSRKSGWEIKRKEFLPCRRRAGVRIGKQRLRIVVRSERCVDEHMPSNGRRRCYV